MVGKKIQKMKKTPSTKKKPISFLIEPELYQKLVPLIESSTPSTISGYCIDVLEDAAKKGMYFANVKTPKFKQKSTK